MRDLSNSRVSTKEGGGLQRVQVSQLVFVAFTLVQIALFIFAPQLYDKVTHSLDGPPFYATYRLIGSKELGLMAIYLAGILANDWDMAKLTVFGRLTTLVVLPYMVISEGAPWVVMFGIVQDIIGALSTAYFLVTERRGETRYAFSIRTMHSILPRLVIGIAGTFEAYYGINLFWDPLSRALSPQPLFGGPKHINLRLFGYMTSLLGIYQLVIAIKPQADGLAFLAVAFHHLNFYITTRTAVSAVTGEPFNPPHEHLYCGWAALISTVLAAMMDKLAKVDSAKKHH